MCVHDGDFSFIILRLHGDETILRVSSKDL